MKTLRERNGLNMKEAAEKIGIPYTTYVNYEKGLREPSSETLIAIADFYGTTVDYLIGKTSNHNLPANIIPVPKMNQIPLVGTIACGTPILAAENVEEHIDIPEHIHADFALRCKGDSMIGADIRNNDIVYIKQTPEVNDGEIAAVLIEDEATLKRVYYDKPANQITLIAENTGVRPMVYSGEALNHIKILGRAVGLSRSLIH